MAKSDFTQQMFEGFEPTPGSNIQKNGKKNRKTQSKAVQFDSANSATAPEKPAQPMIQFEENYSKNPSASGDENFSRQSNSAAGTKFSANDSQKITQPANSVTGITAPNSDVFAENSSTDKVTAQSDLQTLATPGDLSDKVVVLVDSHSLIYQIFHAMAPMTSPSGIPIAVLHGFLRDIADLRARWQPAYVWCAFDRSEVTFRNDLYTPYKEHREPMPDELRMQIPLVQQSLELIGVGIVDAAGFEADDVLATLAAQVSSAGGRTVIVTSDKDCRQLITDRVQLFNIRKNEVFGATELKETWGIRPDQVADFQALVGDSVDNVPGVPLIGPKFAQKLIEQFGTLENILEHADQVGGKKAENLVTFREQALLSRQLTKLSDAVPLNLNWHRADFSQQDDHRLREFFREFGIRKLADRFLPIEAAQPETATTWIADYQVIDSASKLSELVKKLAAAKLIALDTETTSTNPRWAEPVGYSFAWEVGQAAYIPLRSPSGQPKLDLQLVNAGLKSILADPAIAKVGQNLKYDIVVLRSQELSVQGIACDTMVADYLIDPGQREHGLDELAKRYLGHDNIKITELIGSGRNQRTMDQVDVGLITQYAAEDADVPLRLEPIVRSRLQQLGLDELFTQVEMPLVEVLAEIEFNGICIDVGILQKLSEQFAKRLDQLYQEVIELAGEPFNLDSPKQLATILFDKLKLPIVKRTQTGNSTDAEVLEQLASKHPLPSKLIEYRQLAKLKGTYIDALPTMVCPRTGRVHSSFRQDVAATGRLSSTDPNLQNIPVRTDEGRQIRSAFRAGPDGWKLLAADYSQIELRVLAHYCGDENLRVAFANDRDIHAQVASEVYGVPLADVSSAQRRNAKAINFGIIYGQSPFGLAKALQISKEAAADFIDAYFARFPGVRQFMFATLDACRRQGYVSTLLGRRRYIKGVRNFSELNETRRRVLVEPERIAVNTVIQGSAADLIKMAMIRVYRRLQQSGLQAKLLLQIHDELVLEVASEDCPALAQLVREEMTQVARLDVPLKVDVKSGANWAECDPM